MFYEIKWLIIEWVTKLNYGWIIAVGLCFKISSIKSNGSLLNGSLLNGSLLNGSLLNGSLLE